MTAETRAENVVEALARVIRDLPGIEKGGRASAQQGGYAYRGIDQITREVSPLLAKHGVVITPAGIEWQAPRELTVNGKPWTDERCAVRYRAYGPGGPQDFIEVGPIPALGRDNADKGANKCMTQAFKYALMQLLCIGDAKDDADGQTHEADARQHEDGRAALDAFFRAMHDEPEAVQDAVREWWKGYDKTSGSLTDALERGRAVRDHHRHKIETGEAGDREAPETDDGDPGGAQAAGAGPDDALGTSPVSDAAFTDEPTGYDAWSREDLAAECADRGLPKSGPKQRLVNELEAWDATNGPKWSPIPDVRPF